MKFWAARDKNGSLWIYPEKPVKDEKGYNCSCKSFQVDKDWLRDDPIEIKVKK